MKRPLIFAVLGLIILTQYVNCSNYSQTMDTNVSDSSSFEAFEGLRVLNGDTYMNCDEDHVQIGGVCNTADAKYNCIQIKIMRDNSTVYWGSTSLTDNIGCDNSYKVKCENGHFFAIIPKPNDSILSSAGSQNIEYILRLKLNKSSDGSQWEEGIAAPGFNFYIQQNGACGS